MIPDEVLDALARYSRDPLGFVLWAFPWGEEGELRSAEGPREWQAEVLSAIRDGLLTPDQAVRLAVVSGHGIGKSALVAWIILWSMCTFEDCRGVVTANTEKQLTSKTWAELSKWHRLCLAGSMFTRTATRLYSVDPGHADTWRFDMIPWSEANPEAFAGLHNKGRRILLVFDEASAIHDRIWETASGALTDTDTQIIWFVAGNPTRNSGAFRDCFGAQSHRWRRWNIDSRHVPGTNTELFNEWIEDYGFDSDWVRVRVRGEFPRVGLMEFISLEDAEAARDREVPESALQPLIFGVDVARFGDNASVIYRRRGRDGRSLPPIILRGVDLMTLASRIIDQSRLDRPDAIFIDEGGMGAGVVDRLRQLRVHCIGINFGAKADRLNVDGDESLYANKRSEMWGGMRSWLRVGAIASRSGQDDNLVNQLVAPLYGFSAREEILLEKKESMRKRGVPSPDIADALALTFAYPVMARRDGEPLPVHEVDYDPLAAFTLEVA